MSVINKVLRDLDQRKGAGRMQSPLEGTAVAANVRQRRWWSSPVMWLLLLVVVGAVGLVAWWVERDPTVSSATESSEARANALPAQPATVAPVKATEPVPTVMVVPQPAASSSVPKPAPVLLAVPVMTVPKAAPQPPATASALVRPIAVASAPDQPQPTSAGASLTQVAQEVLVQAQAQWAQGDQVGAAQLVRDLLGRWPRDDTQHVTALAQAVREAVRMALAQNRPDEALATLVRWELPLAPVADIWALRGQVTQRLGLHAQAVHAYTSALERSPGQARWMLAAAVSLAAQGQTAPAAELAEKARRAGFLPPDVANYLQQLGVTLRAP